MLLLYCYFLEIHEVGNAETTNKCRIHHQNQEKNKFTHTTYVYVVFIVYKYDSSIEKETLGTES